MAIWVPHPLWSLKKIYIYNFSVSQQVNIIHSKSLIRAFLSLLIRVSHSCILKTKKYDIYLIFNLYFRSVFVSSIPSHTQDTSSFIIAVYSLFKSPKSLTAILQKVSPVSFGDWFTISWFMAPYTRLLFDSSWQIQNIFFSTHNLFCKSLLLGWTKIAQNWKMTSVLHSKLYFNSFHCLLQFSLRFILQRQLPSASLSLSPARNDQCKRRCGLLHI